MSYTVRFDRGNRGWTSSVFQLDGNGQKSGATVATGTGLTQAAAKEAALASTANAAISAALRDADPTRPHWEQGKQDEARRATASEGRTRAERRFAQRSNG